MSVSIGDMRNRLLAKLAEPRPVETWVEVLASAGNRELLGLIGSEEPQSIGALADFAHRAQPNVSRALSSLVSAGLVETRGDGRRTIPRLTTLGYEKARDYNLLDLGAAPEVHVDEDHIVATVIEDVSNDDAQGPDLVPGLFELSVWERASNRASAAVIRTDLNELAQRVLTDWWRMLYRRNSFWRLGDAVLQGKLSDRRVTVHIGSNGRAAEFSLRDGNGEAVLLAGNGEPIPRFENALLEAFVRPVAANLRVAGRVDRPLHSMLARLMESRADVDETGFCRVAGALDISPYELSDDVARDVRKVVFTFADEDARLDFASSLAVDELREQSDWLDREIARHADSNGLGALDRLRARCVPTRGSAPLLPWRLGRDCARMVRKEFGFGADRGVRGFAEVATLFGADGFEVSEVAPGALRGFQTMRRDEPVVFVEDEGSIPTAFTLCRAIGDYVAHGSPASCVADIYTERQAVGRAFAAEFLAPGEGVVRMAEEEGQSIGRIARHFGVAPEVVHRQYDNYSRALQY